MIDYREILPDLPQYIRILNEEIHFPHTVQKSTNISTHFNNLLNHLFRSAVYFIVLQRAFCYVGFTLCHAVIHVRIWKSVFQHFYKRVKQSLPALIQMRINHVNNRQARVYSVL